MGETAQVLCCGCCAAIAGFGIATLIFAAYILYYVLTIIFGCIIIYYGCCLRSLLLSYETFIAGSDDYLLYSSLCIAVGTMFTVVVILSLCSQRYNASKLMVVSSIIQLAVLVVGIYTFFWAYPGTDGVDKFLSRGFDSAMNHYKERENAWAELQQNLECCGKANYKSWSEVDIGSDYPPTSCCRKQIFGEEVPDTCSYAVDYENSGRSAMTIYVQGCFPKVKEDMISLMRKIQGILIPFLVITLIGFISNLCNAGAKKADSTEGQKVGGLYVNIPIKEKGEKDVEAGEGNEEDQELKPLTAPDDSEKEKEAENGKEKEKEKDGTELESVAVEKPKEKEEEKKEEKPPAKPAAKTKAAPAKK